MMNWGAAMREAGEGERAAQARSRKFWSIVTALFLAGGVIGAFHAVMTDGNMAGDLPGGAAIAIAAIWAISLTVGSWYFFRSIDELELHDNLWAGTFSLYFYCIAYPVWFVLWKGGLTLEPMHEVMFIATMIVMCASYLWMKVRR